MQSGPHDLARIRLENALALFEEFVRATARHADAATLRGLERRFAERVQIQPSYWSQIKSRSRQIGERLARQFELLCHKPAGWLDQAHGNQQGAAETSMAVQQAAGPAAHESQPQNDDERFILGLVLTYYRRHPQRARTRLLDLLGEVLTAPAAALESSVVDSGLSQRTPARAGKTTAPLSPAAEDAHGLWLKSQSGVAPLKRKK